MAVKLFDSDKEALEYMNDYDLHVSRALLLEKKRQYFEAAECYLQERNSLEAIRLLLLDSRNDRSKSKAAQCILEGLWSRLSFGAPEKNLEDPELVKLLEYAEIMKSNGVHESIHGEVRSGFHWRFSCLDLSDNKCCHSSLCFLRSAAEIFKY